LVLTKAAPAHGGIGHNKPPIADDTSQDVALQEAGDAQKTISTEVAKSEPNALEVANATSRLSKVLGWLHRKLDKVADSFATTTGNAGAVAVAAAMAPRKQSSCYSNGYLM